METFILQVFQMGKYCKKINLGGEIAGSPIFCRDGIFIGTLKGDLYKLVPKQP